LRAATPPTIIIRMSARVSLKKGDDRHRNVLGALQAIEGDIKPGERIVLKPNLVSITRPLAATHADALRAVLEFLRARTDREIVIAEGSASSDTMKGFQRYGFVELARRYGARLVDLNRDAPVEVEVADRDLRPLKLRVARTIVESDYRVSLAPMKTHDAVVVTMSLKNLVMGSLLREHRDMGPAAERFFHGLAHWIRPGGDPLYPRAFGWVVRRVLRSDKLAMHQTYATLNWNLFLIARRFPAHLAVLDGFTGMEGAGPTRGTPVDLRVAIASTDFIAADAVGARVMGFEPHDVGYLHHAMERGLGEGDPARIELLGERIEDCLRPFQPHPGYRRQLGWKDSPHAPALAGSASR